jgi:hypothetical protein
MTEEITYWEVSYKNIEGDTKWTVVKCPIDMDEYDILSKMMNDTEVSQVYSAFETNTNDYSRDFTNED